MTIAASLLSDDGGDFARRMMRVLRVVSGE